MEAKSLKEAERTCVLCCQDVDIYALGKCDHPVCYQCSTKMRVLCEQKYCAVCREELDKVVFIKKLEPFAAIDTRRFQCERKYDIYFCDGKTYSQFRRILQSECPQCPEPRIFATFEELEYHMRKQHELFCCKLCAKHLKIFSHERKWYNRKDLARHRTQGDPDDTSHRGHPLCKFCDDRYLDNDELLKHLRRDHYFCHFCDSDGAQEYYSDYPYLRDHFRESHFLCEEGRCSTEQFTHAFRTEIDYKAHKAAAHSKNRAEARQNRQIDLQFNYAPRHPRRNEGIGGEDYEEVDRFNRQGRSGRGGARGAPPNRRVSWRYDREEEDRDIAAAVRASIAARKQEERRQASEREAPKARKEELMDVEETRNHKRAARPPGESLTPKDIGQSAGPKEPQKGDDFPLLAIPAANTPPAATSLTKPAGMKLQDADFPRLSGSSPSPLMTPAYTAPARKPSAFQEDDFPALVPKISLQKPMGSTTSAWSQCGSKNVVQPSKPTPMPGPAFSSPAGRPPPSSATSQLRKPQAGGGKAPARVRSPSSEEDDEPGRSAQDIRSVPTMLDISSLLTGTSQQGSKVNKRKKQPAAPPPGSRPPGDSVSSTAQKENVPEANQPPALIPPKPAVAPKTSPFINGHIDKPSEKPSGVPKEPPGLEKRPASDPCLLPREEDFPALIPKQLPPPGFKSTFPLSGSQNGVPPPPPGLAAPPSKPPPGFTGIPLNANVDPAVPPANESAQSPRTYLRPENFQERNMDLIQSIKNFLLNDASKFNEFKTYSIQFRQGIISAAQYHQSCRDLLGENFKRIFNELLVLLPDTEKQRELLAAHGDFKALEKQSSSKHKKNKKSAWQTGSGNSSLELDCQVCPTCRQVVAQKDFTTHKTLHMSDDDFPSLQAISKIIS
ncbi:E3 ubiquitin-protein ligase ZNF598 [Paramormyrops kingsleyae]|uniref:E3 ubiquitin-protein ligase ZNF598 n=1 Tax=Paramormyrops kingsleyae TaxID=1676925 RepID=UPI003B979A7A